jgi:hypothetical protein
MRMLAWFDQAAALAVLGVVLLVTLADGRFR